MKNEKIDPKILAAISVLLEGYKPVEYPADATHFFTTHEIAESIADHTGAWPSFDLIWKSMKEKGFRYARRGGLGLFWMLREI